MTLAEQAAKAIKDATGWDASPTQAGAIARRPTVQLHVWQESPDRWICGIHPSNTESWPGTGPTPEAAIAAVLPRYRAHIASLAADILPGWPRLEWDCEYSLSRLNLHVGNVVTPVLDIMIFESLWSVAAPKIPTPQIFTRAKVLAWVEAHVESLALPCPLPPFPETSDAS